jgi:NADH dehydrogenase FAD-containing subunit
MSDQIIEDARCADVSEGRKLYGATCKVLILGGGVGGTYAALEFERILSQRILLRGPAIEVTLITRDNYFLFTPMLHEVAASDLELNAIVSPLRKLFRRVGTFTGNVDFVELSKRRIVVSHGFDGHKHELSYDHLIVALGSNSNFFGLPGVEEGALTIKTLEDAINLRNRLISYLEEANSECAAAQRQPLLTFVVASGGFAGVETVGGINDFVREAIRFYPNLNKQLVRTVLISSENFILPELGHRLGSYAHRKLTARGVEVITGARVQSLREGSVLLSDGAGSQQPHSYGQLETRLTLHSPTFQFTRTVEESRSTNILKSQVFQACGRWVTALWFPTAREDTILRPPSMHFARGAAQPVIFTQRSEVGQRGLFDIGHKADSP